MMQIEGIIKHAKRTLLGVLMQRALGFGNKKDYALAIGISPWKENFIAKLYSDYSIIFVDKQRHVHIVRLIFKNRLKKCLVWSFEDERLGIDQESLAGLPLNRIEDGFIRSIGRGLDKTLPWSLCIDKKGMYFKSASPSDFEDLCRKFKAEQFPDCQRVSTEIIGLMKKLSISKYNFKVTQKRRARIPQNSNQEAVLVLGQVEDDRSIISNENALSCNTDLLKQAVEDNPGCLIFFKQHPDCVGVLKRPGYVNVNDHHQVIEVDNQTPIYELLESVDRVYTISSLGGFEALLFGKKVVTFGCPFYAGWGLTQDHVTFAKRQHHLSLDQLFYIAYILYPVYFDPNTGKKMDIKQLLQRFSRHLSTPE